MEQGILMTVSADELAKKIEDMSGIQKAVAKLYSSAGTAFGDDIFKTLLKINNKDLGVANEIWKYVAIIGMVMLCIFFLIDLSKASIQAMSDSRLQQIASPFFKLILGIAFLQYGDDIVGGLLGIGNKAVDFIYGKNGKLFDGTGSDSITTQLIEQVAEMNLLEATGQLVPASIFWLASIFVSLIILYQAISRKIEIVLRVGLTPIALGDVYQLENSTAIRYLKKLFALVLWGFIMVAILKIGSNIVAGDLSTIFKTDKVDSISMVVFMPLLVPLAEAGMISSSKQILFDALGC